MSWRAIYERLFERGPDSFSPSERETIRAAIEEAFHAGHALRSPGTTETGTRECEAWREQWVAGAAAVYRHDGNTPDRAESRARWLLDVTHGPALPVSRGEASVVVIETGEAGFCDSCGLPDVACSCSEDDAPAPSPGSETPPRCSTPPAVCEPFVGAGPCDLCAAGSETPRGAEPRKHLRVTGHLEPHDLEIVPGDNHAEKEE